MAVARLSQLTPVWCFPVHTGPSHSPPREGNRSSEKGRDLSKECWLHAYCVPGSPFTTSTCPYTTVRRATSTACARTTPSTSKHSLTALTMHDEAQEGKWLIR